MEPAAADAEDSALSARGLGPRFFLKAPQSKHMLSSFSLSPGSFLVKRKAVCAIPPPRSAFRVSPRLVHRARIQMGSVQVLMIILLKLGWRGPGDQCGNGRCVCAAVLLG